jgi:hypothetical protein
MLISKLSHDVPLRFWSEKKPKLSHDSLTFSLMDLDLGRDPLRPWSRPFQKVVQKERKGVKQGERDKYTTKLGKAMGADQSFSPPGNPSQKPVNW